MVNSINLNKITSLLLRQPGPVDDKGLIKKKEIFTDVKSLEVDEIKAEKEIKELLWSLSSSNESNKMKILDELQKKFGSSANPFIIEFIRTPNTDITCHPTKFIEKGFLTDKKSIDTFIKLLEGRSTGRLAIIMLGRISTVKSLEKETHDLAKRA